MMKTASIFAFSVDKALGAAGCGLAVASLGFGVYMNVHGPVSSFGTSRDFTVFAQLAPKRHEDSKKADAGRDDAKRQARPIEASDLDMSATASIPAPSTTPKAPQRDPQNTIIPSVTLESASADSATISIDGRAEIVRVGDLVPGAGEVLDIRPGRRAVVKTSLGLILPSQ